ncbi:MAG: DUF1002 domain-containing protein [Lachnospiraceae bacterium]|jgi:hypothetical protein|nr:DUF1002 domain-containing protein [Lachnospiraceae bacterium]
MKRILTVMMTVMMCAGLLAGAFGMTAKAQETTGTDIGGMLGGVKDKLSEAIAGMDEGTVGEVLNFVKEKVSDGSLKTEDGLTQAIREGEEKFGVTVDRADAQKVVDTMEKLEDMGFSGEYVMEKAKELYDEHGTGFVDHIDEVVAGAVKDAVAGAASGFFSNLWESTKSFLKNLVA